MKEKGIRDNFRISGLIDWVSDEDIKQDGEYSRKRKIYEEK